MHDEFDFSREEELLGSGELGQNEMFEFEFDREQSYENDRESDHEFDREHDHESRLSDEQEMELAAELLTISGEAEMEQFLGRFFKTARGVLNTQAGQQLKGLLRNAAKSGLKLGGQAIGSYFGGDKGGSIGSDAGALAGRIFGLELEGMSAEDQELEVAKGYVRLATDAVNRLASSGPVSDAAQAARSAFGAAAQRYAPGLLRGRNGSTPGSGPRIGRRSGVWRRVGRTIVVHGIFSH
ncbi:MAG: hypothetical protein QOF63_3182 [Thermoanaerobaculia bacterium]|jgi:hypothetical protein|nr:hypothetical protein [Thermoanaerobaculia bacterium]MEA2413516.1 hypothetical protein [Thermoanaerobaculia bacterium]